MMVNHIIVIIRYVLLMRSNKSTDCYPFHGGRTTTTTTNTTHHHYYYSNGSWLTTEDNGGALGMNEGGKTGADGT
jgi:hypothetical protein